MAKKHIIDGAAVVQDRSVILRAWVRILLSVDKNCIPCYAQIGTYFYGKFEINQVNY